MSQRDSVVLNCFQELLQVESGHRDNRCATFQALVQSHYQAVDVKERQNADEPVVFIEVIQAIHLTEIGDEILMCQHHSLWKSGGAARVWQHHQILTWVDLDRRNIAIAFKE